MLEEEEMPYIRCTNQTQIYYESHGKGKPIVFVHPPGMGHVTFKLQQPLSKKFQVITYDLRGNGKSDPGTEDITISLLANDILQLIDQLAFEKVVVCGYSNGGSIALEFALSNPDRVEGIILIGGFSEVNTFLLRSEFKLGISTVRMNRLSVLAKVLGKAHGTTKEYKKEIEQYVKKANVDILYQMYIRGLEYNCSHRLKDIIVPVLLVDGSFDFYMHSYQRFLEREIPNAERVFVNKARHQVPTRHAHTFNQLIETFMEKL